MMSSHRLLAPSMNRAETCRVGNAHECVDRQGSRVFSPFISGPLQYCREIPVGSCGLRNALHNSFRSHTHTQASSLCGFSLLHSIYNNFVICRAYVKPRPENSSTVINLQQNPTLSTMLNKPSPSSCHHVISTSISKGPIFATKIARTASFTSEAFRYPATTRSTSVTNSSVSSRRLTSTLRTSFINPDSCNLADHEYSLPQCQTVSETPLQQFKALKLADVILSLQSKRRRKLKYYTYLAGHLAGEGRLLEFAELLQMLADAGVDRAIFTIAVDKDQVDAGLCLLLVNSQLDLFVSVLKKLHKAGFAVWKFTGRGSLALLSDELRKLLARGKAQYCVQIIHTLSEFGFLVKKLVNSSRVIASCAKSRNLQVAHNYVRLLSPKPWHYNVIIREFGYHNELRSALSVFDLMKEDGVAPDIYTYRALIDACGRGGQPSQATVVFQGMIKDGIQPNVFLYNSMMNVNVGNMEEVQHYYRHMQGAGVAADLTTFNILLKACGASARADLAVVFYKDIQQRGDLTMDVVTYSSLINVFGGAKLWEEALKVKSDMLKAGVTPNVVTWTSIIGACATAGLVEQCFREYDEMLNVGCAPNVYCYNMLIHSCVKAGQYDRAFQLFEEWKQNGRIKSLAEIVNRPDPSTHCYELIAVTGNSMQTSSGKLSSSVRSACCTPNLVTYNMLMKACGSAPERARELLVEMKALGLVPDLKSWSILMDAYGSKGDVLGCVKSLEEMKDVGITPDVIAYTAVIKGCVQAGEPDKAFEFFKQMKTLGVRPNVVTYNTLLRAQRTCGKFSEVQRALAVYEEMREAGYAPNDFLLQGLLTEWAEGATEVPVHLRHEAVSLADSHPGTEFTEALLQKVAVHARGENPTENLIIDLHGLSKGEARTAVLAVLRIIKERHSRHNPVAHDLVIITGTGRRSEVPGVSVVKEVVLRVLQKELGLPVVGVPLDTAARVPNTWSEEARIGTKEPEKGTPELVERFVVDKLVHIVSRRPVNSGRLKVSKEALNAWLGKKSQLVSDQREG